MMEKRRDETRGIDFHVDTRSPEAAAAHEAERDAHRVETLGKLGSDIAYFDEHGVCRAVGDAAWPLDGFAHSAPVAHGTKPHEVTLDRATGQVAKAKPATIAIPEAHPAGEMLTIDLPDGVVAEVEGVPHTGRLQLQSDVATRVSIELHGRQRGSFVVEFQTYRERRAAAYLPIAEQLDLMFKDPDAWRAHVAAVKAEHPK